MKRHKCHIALVFALSVPALALSACSTTRWVQVPCITPEQLEELRAAEPDKVGDRLTGHAGDDVKILAGSAIRLRQWGRSNLMVLEGCQG